ncbi:hypothetical protein D3C78_1319370 [compost metagenome]
MQTVTIGAFEYEHVGTFWRLHRAQHGITTAAQIPREHPTTITLNQAHIALYIGRAQQVASTLQADAAFDTSANGNIMPMPERHRYDQLIEDVEIMCHVYRFTTDAQFVRILQYQRKKLCRRFATENGASVAGCQ